MPKKKRRMSTKLYVAISLLVILVVATAAIVYSTMMVSPKSVMPGVNVGDTFVYSLTGTTDIIGPDAVVPSSFSSYNDTEYFKITITGVQGSTVSLDTAWLFKNGTKVTDSQWIDTATGNKSDTAGFWAIYPANLSISGLLRPRGFDGITVNDTSNRAYADSVRQTNYYLVENEFFDVNDPTYSTWRYDFRGVYFDRATGMLVTFTNIQEFNNPHLRLIITWKLTNSTVWNV